MSVFSLIIMRVSLFVYISARYNGSKFCFCICPLVIMKVSLFVCISACYNESKPVCVYVRPL